MRSCCCPSVSWDDILKVSGWQAASRCRLGRRNGFGDRGITSHRPRDTDVGSRHSTSPRKAPQDPVVPRQGLQTTAQPPRSAAIRERLPTRRLRRQRESHHPALIQRRPNKGADTNTISNPRMMYPGLIVLKPKPNKPIPKTAITKEPMVRIRRGACCMVGVYTARPVRPFGFSEAVPSVPPRRTTW